MRGRNVRSIFKTFIIFSFCVIIFLYGGNVKSQEKLKIAKPAITQYQNVQIEILDTKTFRIEDIFDCKFYDPNNDSAFMKHLERNIADIAFRKMVINNHYGAIISFSTPDHPSGSDTVFYPTKDTTICNKLKKAKAISVNMISCMGDHYPPCWFGIGGLVKEACTEQNIESCGEVSKLDSSVQDGELYFNLGQESLQEGKYDQAISDFSLAIEANPKYFQAFNSRGIAYYRKGQYDLAIADYSSAIELNSKDAMLYYNRGVSYANKGENDKAISDFSKAIEINKNDSGAYSFRGIVYKNKGQYDKAISDFSRAIALTPNDAAAYNYRGMTYAEKSQNDKAIVDYSKAIEIYPKFSLAYNNRGFAYSNKAQYNNAISDYNKALEMDPKNAYAYENLGTAYFKLNNKESSCANFQKACDLGLCGGKEWAKKEGHCQ